MKLGARDAARFLGKPEGAAAILLYGPDAMRTALKRAALVETLIGPSGAAEMRLERLTAADVRRSPATLLDLVKATGFFPGPRAVLLEEAGDLVTPAVVAVLQDWKPGDAVVVITAGNLTPGNSLRKAMEAARNGVAIAIYADPPDRAEVEAALARVGLAPPDRETFVVIESLAHALDPGDFAQFVEKLALYRHGETTPLSIADVEACAPPEAEADLDTVVALAADGEVQALVPAFRRLTSNPTALAIAAGRYFRTLHGAATATDGPDAALARARPPVFGPRRTRMAAQARAFGPDRLERALELIMDADLTLRSSCPTPAAAVTERLFVRLAMLRRGRD